MNVIPVFRKVDAVYFDEETEGVFRLPVFGIWWDEERDVEFFTSGADGIFDAAHEDRNFIGYEFDGNQRDWAEDIERIKRRLK